MRLIAAVAFAALVGGGPAMAQSLARIRGTIGSLSGQALVVQTRDGDRATVTLAPDATITAVTVTTLGEIHPGSFIGTAATAQPDGTLRALEVHVFPESMRGAGEGNRPWDLPQSTMTNGTVGQIAGRDGRRLTVKYKDGEKTVMVPADVPIVAFEPGTMAQLTPGAHVVITATKAPDGALGASRVTVGKDGIDLPL